MSHDPRRSGVKCHRFFNFCPCGLTPGPKVTKRGDDLVSTLVYHPTKFQPDRANGVRDMRYQIFQSLALIFDLSGSSKVKCDCESRKPVGPAYKCSLGSNLIYVTVIEIFRVKILTVDLLTLPGPTPRPKVTRRGDDLLSS